MSFPDCPQLNQDLAIINSLRQEFGAALASMRQAGASPAEVEKSVKQAKELKKQLKEQLDALWAKFCISATIKEGQDKGKEVTFNLLEQLKYWGEFYKNEGVDWVKLPSHIEITAEQAKEMKRQIEELGFNKMIIIPEGLADTGEKYEKEEKVMT